MKGTAAWVISLGTALWGAAAYASSPAAAPPMTWEDCVALALRRNPDLASSRYAVQAGRSSYYGSYNGLLPQLNLSDSYSDSKGATSASRHSAAANLSVEVWSPSQLARIKSASASLKLSEASLRQTSASLRFDLKRAFSQTLLAQDNVKVSEAVKAIRERGARLVELRYQAGRESKGNMLRTSAELLRAEADLAQARRTLRTSQMNLARQLGLDEYQPLEVTGTFTTSEPPAPDLDLRPYLANRPDISLEEGSLKAAQADLQQSRSSLWPSLSASYNRSWTGSTQFPHDRNSWSLGGVLNYPLFGGGPTATHFAISSAKNSVKRSEEALRSSRNAALADLEAARADFAGAVDQVRVQTALIEASRQRNDEADIRYASGLLSFDNWELIVTDRVGFERQNLQARLSAVVAEAAWHRAMGKGLGDER